MGDIVNLRRVRKARERVEAAAAAERNRAAFGRSKAERQRSEAAADASARRLNAHRREPREGPEEA